MDFQGTKNFRLLVLSSTLTRKRLFLDRVRPNDVNPGFREHEITFLRIISEITQGTITEISECGTQLRFTPGTLVGGSFEFDTGNKIGIAYYAEPLILLGLFAKNNSRFKFSGLTSDDKGQGVDALKYYYDNFLDFLGISSNVTIKITSRGFLPKGKGDVLLEVNVLEKVSPFSILPPTKIEKIRGLLASTKTNHQICSNIISELKENLQPFFKDVYIYMDSGSAGSDPCPGFSLALVGIFDSSKSIVVSETNSSIIADISDFARESSKLLIKKVAKCMHVDQERFWMLLLFMSVSNGVSSVHLKNVPEGDLVSLVEECMGVKFIKSRESASGFAELKCMGVGLTNNAKEYK